MQKVIEAARAQSYAAFMQNPTPTVPMPAAVPAIIPAAVPEIKKETSKDRDTKVDKRDRKRSRSRSRDRKDRDRRDRRYRDRSRSRSRERRERRRRDRSRSRGRSRSRDRDRKTRDRKRSPENYNQKESKKLPEVWANQNSNDGIPAAPLPPSLINNFSGNLDDARRNLNALNVQPNTNGRGNYSPSFGAGRSRDSWPPQNVPNESGPANFLNRSDDSLPNEGRQRSGASLSYQNRRFQRSNFQRAPENEQFSPAEREPLPNSCVRLQPFYGGYGDIRRFFQGSFISNVGIKFINDDYGHRTGIVYIQFGHPQGKSEALRRNGEILNGVKVEVAHIDDPEFDDAVDRYQPENFPTNTEERGHKFRSKNITKYFNKPEPELKVFSCLTVDDLPTYVKEQDILKLFSPRPLISLFLTSKPRGGHIAYVKFGSAEEAKKALEEKSNHIVEGKPVTVKACEDRDFDNISQQHNVDLDCKPSPVPMIDTDCINLTRLPLQTNNIEITDFFSDVGVRPLKIHLMSNRLGFTGQAFCEFKNKEEAAQALKKDNASFGPNHVSVQPFPRDEMEHILQQSQVSNAPIQSQPQNTIPRAPLLNQINQNRPFFARNNYEGAPRGGHRFMGHRGPRPRFMNAVPTDDAPPGCTVFMDNVPYKAGTNEILDFFDGYDITNNVSRRFNPNNTPSAEAKVIFNSPEEAYRAVQEKNGQKIWERPIYLKQI
ncbi:RRM 1 domain containing protein [Asbolus verrucosus]|uniref:RRM 1 domain containing protein n=1 Tax=Asbolus verrucosus TaxID=1661398 RepID=A0A482VZ27_ASBVE|nr:RRM 1 domain containing protein [Asbolus verrucosus]